METIGYIAVGVLVALASLFLAWALFTVIYNLRLKARKPEDMKPERLLGTVIPELKQGLDIEKRYDILYGYAYGYTHGNGIIERLNAVRILGYIGQEEDVAVKFGHMYMRSRWLVVEFPDGRKAYLQPESIQSLQESAVPAPERAVDEKMPDA